jgi:hypothetical protein
MVREAPIGPPVAATPFTKKPLIFGCACATAEPRTNTHKTAHANFKAAFANRFLLP